MHDNSLLHAFQCLSLFNQNKTISIALNSIPVLIKNKHCSCVSKEELKGKLMQILNLGYSLHIRKGGSVKNGKAQY